MMEYADHFYRSADDRLDLYARIYNGEGPTLLLMHGLTRNSADFEPLAGYLAGHYQLIVPDQRGRGRSAYDPEPANYSPVTYVEDMYALLDGLQITRAVLIGTSMGGLMAMMIAAKAPQLTDGIVINDIGPAIDHEGLDRIKAYVGVVTPFANWEDAAKHSKNINQHALPRSNDSDWMEFARRTCVETTDGRIKLNYDPAISIGLTKEDPSVAPADLWPMWDLLSAIPVLVIRGGHSDILSKETVAEMARRHPDSFNAIEIPLRGHAPMLDEPEAEQSIMEFLTDLQD